MSILVNQSAWPENDPDQEVAGHLREVQQIGQRASHQGCRKHQASKCNVAKYFHRKQSVALKLSLDTATEIHSTTPGFTAAVARALSPSTDTPLTDVRIPDLPYSHGTRSSMSTENLLASADSYSTRSRIWGFASRYSAGTSRIIQ